MTMSTRTSAVLALVTLSAGLLLVGVRPGPASEGESLPPPNLEAAEAVDSFAAQLKVGPPRRHEGLTLYPVYADEARVPPVDLTFDEAMKQGILEIRELTPAEVNRVRLVSTAKDPIFVMGGEMMTGAKQDRIIGDDMIVPPGADLTIPVFCVEHGRWVAKSESFSSAGFIAAGPVRKARAAADQGEVWSEVASQQERLEAPSATGSLRSIQDSAAVQEKLEPYRRALADFPREVPKARGVVVCVGDEIVSADLFSSGTLFAQLWPKLLDSYIVDAVGRPSEGRPPDAVRVREWLRGIGAAACRPRTTPGNGTLYRLDGPSLVGSALVYDGGVVHIELFAQTTPEPVPFNRLQFRRDRLEENRGVQEAR